MKRATVALVDEARCIGCTRCIDACPVDAIVGAQGMMHTVVEPWCIGCALCLPPCPVDCIDMVAPRRAWTAAEKQAVRLRVARRKGRRREVPFTKRENTREVIAATLARKRKA
jgi:electron transport complex protein RnfB